MKLYLIRHGDPDYKNDSLTELGKAQAKALYDYRFKNIKFDVIYASTNGRAMLTAILGSNTPEEKIIHCPWAKEDVGAEYFAQPEEGENRNWLVWHKKYKEIVESRGVQSWGDNWINHPEFINTNVAEGVALETKLADDFMLELGLKHDKENKRYIQVKDKLPDNIALFAHGGFAWSFLSCLLDIPYPIFATRHMCLDTTGVVVIDFFVKDGYTYGIVEEYNGIVHKYFMDKNNPHRP